MIERRFLVTNASLATVLALAGVLFAGCKGSSAPHSEAAGAQPQEAKGPHGGRLLSDGDFQVEVTIYERGVPPEYRLYLYEKGAPLPPGRATASVELTRFGGRVDRIAFKPQQDYLLGDREIEEPHSFDVSVVAERSGKKSAWKFSQREGRVELSDDAVRSSGIRVETVGSAALRTRIELPGEITLNSDKLTHVVPRMSGVIREIRKNQGDDVKKGEVIAVLDSRELAAAKQTYFEAAQGLVFSKKAFEREEGLWKKGIASEAAYLAQEREYQEARLRQQSARQQLEALGVGQPATQEDGQPKGSLTRYEIRAPFDGVLIEKRVATGQAVKDDDDLFTLADLSSVWVNVNVYAKDLKSVKVGQEVTVQSDVLDATATGTIAFLGALVGAQNRSATARVVLPDPDRLWKPGLFVSVAVVERNENVPVAVKRDGLQKFRDWDVVFVRHGNEFEARPLELGREDGDWVEVKSGLQPGERYASVNSFILKADVGKSGASHDH